jgi:hypothetical protein
MEDKSSLWCSQEWAMKPILWEFNPLYTLTTSACSIHFNTEATTLQSTEQSLAERQYFYSCHGSKLVPLHILSLAHNACYPVGTELLTGRNVELTICLCVVQRWWICVYLPPLFPPKLSELVALLGTWIPFTASCLIRKRRKYFYLELLILFLISLSIMSDKIFLIKLHIWEAS